MGCNMSKNPNEPNILPSVGSLPTVVGVEQQGTHINGQDPKHHKVQTREIRLEKKKENARMMKMKINKKKNQNLHRILHQIHLLN